MLRYALTIFLSAFLLFQVQPLISKFILPWFGGTPAVWTTAMLFFQVLLLGGYTYAHVVATKLSPRRQMLVHLAVLAAAVLLLPIVPGDRWKPSAEGNPTWQILLLLGACVGLPYFVLATTSPLMQAWFTRTHPGRSPYRLYALSNVGSLLALLSFPFVFEPSLDLRTQGLLWSLAFAAVAVLTGYCALRAQAGPEGGLLPEAHAELVVSEIGNQQSEIGNGGDSPGWGRRLMWLALPACGSTMFLAVTNQMCLDVAVVPFFWVLPLSLYLLSFIICFDNERWYVRPVWWALMAGGVLAMLWLLRAGVDADVTVRQILTWLGLGAWLGKASDPAVAWTQILGYSLGLFACCMVCHGELVRLKPRPKHLTSFYLMVSAGGALGGIFVSLLAPHTFKTYLEFHIGLWATCALALAAFWVDKKPHLRWPVPWYAALGVAAYFLLAALILMFGPFDWLILGGDKPLRTPEIVGIWALEGLLLAVLAVIGRRRWWWLGAAGYFFVAFLMFGPFDWFGLGGGTPARTAETLSLWAIVGLLVAALAMAGRRRWWWLGAAGCFLLLGGALYLVPTKVKPEAFDLIDLLKLGLWAAWAVAVVAAWLARKPHRQWRSVYYPVLGAATYALIGATIVIHAPTPFPWLTLGGEPVTARALMSLWALLGLFVAGGWAFFERSGPRLLWWLAGACYAALHAALFALHAAKPAPPDSLAFNAGLWLVCALAIAAVWLDKTPHGAWPARWHGAAGAAVYHLAFGSLLVLIVALLPINVGDRPLLVEGILWLWVSLGFLAAAVWVLFELRGAWRGWWFGAVASFILLDGALYAELLGAPSWLARPAPAIRAEHLLIAWLACGLVALGHWQRRWLWTFCLPAFLAVLAYVGADLGGQAAEVLTREGTISMSRNFYGVLKVAKYYAKTDREQLILSHGRINHGAQLTSDDGRRQAITYFGEASGIGMALLHHPRKPEGLRVAVLGLGTGTIAAYGQKGDFYRFYEINPSVIKLSGRLGTDCTNPVFTYLTDSPADCATILGDGRLSLEREAANHQYDVLAMDAFSSDAVPVHLLTAEAFDIYRRQIKPDGIIAVNVTNRFVDLRPVVRAQAERLARETKQDWKVVHITCRGDYSREVYYCSWMLVTANDDFLNHPTVLAGRTPESAADKEDAPILWTDDYSNLFRILK